MMENDLRAMVDDVLSSDAVVSAEHMIGVRRAARIAGTTYVQLVAEGVDPAHARDVMNEIMLRLMGMIRD